MNWEAVITLVFAIAGLAGAFYGWRRNASMALAFPLAYFALMGLLQSFAQTIADQCTLPANQVATLLAYLHFCFQPFFINAVALHFIDKRVASRIDLPVYTLCFTGMTLMLIQLYPFNWAGRCEPGSVMCGELLCTLRDGWHLALMLPITQYLHQIPFYFLTAILLPILYGSWRFMLAYMLCCPLAAFLITNNMNEWPVLAALLAIPFLLVLMCRRMKVEA